ncbi:hypothetical protein [Sporomusa sp. KB1]|uniref:hypothetical protein n=1 Tax=Sporomusa sp. KB1 TaxID=943346 RepID=UPI001C963B28|nr:hypothetical protein [Sporomusa sp. KB1]
MRVLIGETTDKKKRRATKSLVARIRQMGLTKTPLQTVRVRISWLRRTKRRRQKGRDRQSRLSHRHQLCLA